MDKESTQGFAAGLSWTAVVAGAIVGLGLNFLLNLLSLTIGLSTLSFDQSNKIVFSAVGFSGFIVAGVIAMFMTGWVAGVLSPTFWPKRHWGILAGFIAWCISLIVTTVLLTNMIQFAAFHSNFTSHPNMAGVRITGGEPMTTELKQTQSSTPVTAKVELSKKLVTVNAFIAFILFSIGALSSCYGGYLGYGLRLKQRSKR